MFLIFGGAGAVGSTLAKKLLRTGKTVKVAGRAGDRLESMASSGFETLSVDARQESEVKAVFDGLPPDEELEGVVNCVGSVVLKPAHTTSLEQWHEVIETNLTTSFLVTKYATMKMMRQKRGAVVLVSSAAARLGLPNHEAISAAKSGVAALAVSAAATYARFGVRVNAVAPGLIDTPLVAAFTASPAQRETSISMHPLGRIANADDVANAIFWLLSDEASFVTGQVISVDGGLTTLRQQR